MTQSSPSCVFVLAVMALAQLAAIANAQGGEIIDVFRWVVPYDGPKEFEARVGDTMVFRWAQGTHNVHIHPTMSCDLTGAILVGQAPGTEYTFTEEDAGTDMFFSCDINQGGHCNAGQNTVVTVLDTLAILPIETLQPSSTGTTSGTSGGTLPPIINEDTVATDIISVGESLPPVVGESLPPVVGESLPPVVGESPPPVAAPAAAPAAAVPIATAAPVVAVAASTDAPVAAVPAATDAPVAAVPASTDAPVAAVPATTDAPVAPTATAAVSSEVSSGASRTNSIRMALGLAGACLALASV